MGDNQELLETTTKHQAIIKSFPLSHSRPVDTRKRRIRLRNENRNEMNKNKIKSRSVFTIKTIEKLEAAKSFFSRSVDIWAHSRTGCSRSTLKIIEKNSFNKKRRTNNSAREFGDRSFCGSVYYQKQT